MALFVVAATLPLPFAAFVATFVAAFRAVAVPLFTVPDVRYCCVAVCFPFHVALLRRYHCSCVICPSRLFDYLRCV